MILFYLHLEVELLCACVVATPDVRLFGQARSVWREACEWRQYPAT